MVDSFPGLRADDVTAEGFAGIRVTALDLATGDSDSYVIGDGPFGYVVTCGPGCTVTHEQQHANGTVVLTIKPTAPVHTDQEA